MNEELELEPPKKKRASRKNSKASNNDALRYKIDIAGVWLFYEMDGEYFPLALIAAHRLDACHAITTNIQELET